MNINIQDGLAKIEYQKGRRTFKKTVQLNSLIGALVSNNGVRTPLLPMGTRQYLKDENYHTLWLEIPAMKRNVKYINREKKVIFEGLVPFPWGVIELKLGEQGDGTLVIHGSRIYALKRPILSENEELYYWPAANVFNDSRICWGGTLRGEAAKIRSLVEAGKLIDFYFSSDFNTDLHPRLNRYSRYEDMLREIQDQSIFDNSILVPVGKQITNFL